MIGTVDVLRLRDGARPLVGAPWSTVTREANFPRKKSRRQGDGFP
jgi:hypothetical protein